MRALEAARRVQRERGYVVLGFPPNELLEAKRQVPPSVGMALNNFGGQDLSFGWCLEIYDETNRADWESQFALLFPGKKDQNPKLKGQSFWRARLFQDAS